MFLLDKDLLEPKSLSTLEHFYSRRLIHAEKDPQRNDSPAIVLPETEDEEKLLLQESDGRELGKILEAPELQIEVERAVVQIRHSLSPERESIKKKHDPDHSKETHSS